MPNEADCAHDDLLVCTHFKAWLRVAAHAWLEDHAATQAALAATLGMPPPLLSNVLAGNRRLPPRHIDKVALTFGIGAEEQRLIHRFYAWTYARPDDLEAATRLWEGTRWLLSARQNPPVYLEHWSNTAVRELAALPDAPPLDDVDAYAARICLPVPRDRVAAALDLVRTGRLRVGVPYAEPHRTAGDAGDDLHRQGADLLRAAVDLPKAHRHLAAFTDAMSVATARLVQEEVEAFFDRVVAICAAPTPDPKAVVVRVSAAVFPLSHPPGGALFPEPTRGPDQEDR